MDDPENEPDLRFFPVGATVRAGGRLGHVIAVLKRGGRQVRFMDNAETAEFDVSALELWRICGDELTTHPAESPQSALDIQIGGDHYKTMKIQPIQYILANNLGFVEGAVVKYVSRWKVKGEGVTDLKKARHFLDLLIQHEEGK
jgi:hypothetical protein